MITHHLWKLIVAVVLAATLVVPSVSATSTVFQSPPPVPPPNDNFASAMVITSLPFNDPFDMTYATTESNELQYCNSTQKTVWYSYTPSANQVVKVTLSGSSDGNLVIYQAYGPNITDLNVINCTSWSSLLSLTFNANAGTKYYFQVGSIYGYGTTGQLNVETVPPPANDNFANAKVITGLPYDDNTDMTGATRETNEPAPSCGSTSKTIWYAYTPTQSGMISQQSSGPYNTIAVYTGSSLTALQQVDCRYRYWYDYRFLTIQANAGTTYYFQLSTDDNTFIPFHLQVVPPPEAYFGYYPYDPTVFDNVYFYNNSWDPAEIGIQSVLWNFGDGTTSTDWSPSHRYAADGNYTVKLTVTTPDGRTASTTGTVQVKTHDVAITKFTVPQSAAAGQTRQLVVGLNSKRFPEQVRVEFYKSVSGGYAYLGYQDQSVPVRPSNRTTDFQFSYTFTKDDAVMGKVTFRAVATILPYYEIRDAWPADNESIAPPTKVSAK